MNVKSAHAHDCKRARLKLRRQQRGTTQIWGQDSTPPALCESCGFAADFHWDGLHYCEDCTPRCMCSFCSVMNVKGDLISVCIGTCSGWVRPSQLHRCGVGTSVSTIMFRFDCAENLGAFLVTRTSRGRDSRQISTLATATRMPSPAALQVTV